MNSLIVLEPLQISQIDGISPEVSELNRNIASLAGIPAPYEDSAYFGWIYIHSEQAPNPNSRITLTDEVDELGVPRARLDWQLTDEDLRTLRQTTELLIERLGAEHLARCSMVDESSPWDYTTWSNHHIGTTRMHENPRLGVVDANSRVHGVENLFVAGSSTFTKAGAANPTLSLVALALRMGDHLAEVLKS